MNDIKDEKPVLSICIPTYNRIEILKDRINEILACQSTEIEIVVLDNCSTDGTFSELTKITDNRIHIYQNAKKLEAADNWIECLKYATGHYAYHMNDRDYFRVNYLPDFLKTIKKQEISAGYCWPSKGNITSSLFFGVEARKQVPFSGYHPSGLLLNLDYVRKQLDLWDYQNKYIVGLMTAMPHINLIYDLCTLGTEGFLSYTSPIKENAATSFISKVPSGVTLSNSLNTGRMWFEPEMIYQEFLSTVPRICGDEKINRQEKYQIIEKGMEKILKAITVGYTIYRISDDHRYHYLLSRYYIPQLDMTKTTIKYIKRFKKETFSGKHLKIHYMRLFCLNELRIVKYLLYHHNEIRNNNILFKQERLITNRH